MFLAKISSKMSLRSKISGMLVLIILMVAVSLSLLVLKEADATLKFNLLVATFILSLLGVVTGIVLAERVTRPLKRLMYHVNALSRGRLAERMEMTAGGEIGELARAFDHMATELDRRINEIMDAKEHLENLLCEERKMRQEMERSKRLSDIGEFAAVMAHEIRNPLARVMMGAYALKDDSMDAEEGEEALDNILKGVENLNRLVTELLNYTGKVELQRYAAQVWRVLDASLLNLKEEIDRSKVKILRDVDPDLPAVNIDAVKIERVFHNIIKNALQAMPDRGTLKIEARSQGSETQGQVIEVIFSDTGCGIPRENMGRIFSPFFTTKTEGTGLGLALVYRIMEAHGGRIEAESEVGEGSVFRVVLPVVPSVVPSIDTRVPGREGGIHEGYGRGME
ncbi:MAG: HAMP domain-containing protein [Nitrospirae bacterium]|nr:HAMP domain-containing protein [Nitrospirota bacterium]MBI5097271.1 HAMP domain-containing protein [Nitrospirota bacterium]